MPIPRSVLRLYMAVILVQTLAAAQSTTQTKDSTAMMPVSVLDFTVNTIDGKPKSLGEYNGNVLLIVNTASECGYTPQYASLQKLYETYRDRGLRILAFPANNFGRQEPGTNAEIKAFCSREFRVMFDLFEKISVKGNDQHPLYRLITSDTRVGGEVKWNFQKYLVDRSGRLKEKYLSAVDPMSKEVRAAIEKLLALKAD